MHKHSQCTHSSGFILQSRDPTAQKTEDKTQTIQLLVPHSSHLHILLHITLAAVSLKELQSTSYFLAKLQAKISQV